MEMILGGLILYLYRRDVSDLIQSIAGFIAGLIALIPKRKQKEDPKGERDLLEEQLAALEERLSLRKLKQEIEEMKELLK